MCTTHSCHTDPSTTELSGRAFVSQNLGGCPAHGLMCADHVHVHMYTDFHTAPWNAHRDSHPDTHRGKCLGTHTHAYAHTYHPGSAILGQALGQHSQTLPAPSRPQPLCHRPRRPSLHREPRLNPRRTGLQPDSATGGSPPPTPASPELNLEPWDFRLQERTLHIVPWPSAHSFQPRGPGSWTGSLQETYRS